MNELHTVRQFAAIHAARINTPSADKINQALTGQPPKTNAPTSQPTPTLSATQRFSSLFSNNQRSHLDPLLETELMHRPYNL